MGAHTQPLQIRVPPSHNLLHYFMLLPYIRIDSQLLLNNQRVQAAPEFVHCLASLRRILPELAAELFLSVLFLCFWINFRLHIFACVVGGDESDLLACGQRNFDDQRHKSNNNEPKPDPQELRD